jgi:hypothetical protein
MNIQDPDLDFLPIRIPGADKAPIFCVLIFDNATKNLHFTSVVEPEPEP